MHAHSYSRVTYGIMHTVLVARAVLHLCVHVYVIYVIFIEQQYTHMQDHIMDTRSFVGARAWVCAYVCVRVCVCRVLCVYV